MARGRYRPDAVVPELDAFPVGERNIDCLDARRGPVDQLRTGGFTQLAGRGDVIRVRVGFDRIEQFDAEFIDDLHIALEMHPARRR